MSVITKAELDHLLQTLGALQEVLLGERCELVGAGDQLDALSGAPGRLRQGCGTYLHTLPRQVAMPPEYDEDVGYGADPFATPGGDSSPERFNYHVEVVGEWKPKAVDLSKYPHTCGCGAPCYDSGFTVKCSSSACKNYERS